MDYHLGWPRPPIDPVEVITQKDPQINVLPNLSDDLETLAGRIKDSVLLVISKKVIE